MIHIMIHVKRTVGKMATNVNVLYEVMRMFSFVKNTGKKEEQTKRKEMMKNREKEQQRGRQNKLAMIHIKHTLEG